MTPGGGANPRISIIIPVYLGENSISRVVVELMADVAPRFPLEIVLVNDCSPDKSESICITLYKKYPSVVRFFSLSKNKGEHNAVMAGLKECRGEWAVIMDDDSQNPVSAVIKLIETAIAGNDDVVYTYYKEKKHSLFRNLGSYFNDKVANVMLNKPKGLYLSSFKILNRFLINEIIKYDAPFPYIDGLILRTTSYINSVEVEHRIRPEGKSGYTFKKLLMLWSNMFVGFSILPLRVVSITGFICAGIGILLGLQAVIEKILNPDMPAGYATLVVAVAFFSGIQLIALGTVGEYVGRMFLKQNRRPQYTIRKRFE